MIRVIEYYVPCHYDFMVPCQSYHARLRARGVRGGLAPPAGGLGGAPPMFVVAKKNIKLILSRVVVGLNMTNLLILDFMSGSVIV